MKEEDRRDQVEKQLIFCIQRTLENWEQSKHQRTHSKVLPKWVLYKRREIINLRTNWSKQKLQEIMKVVTLVAINLTNYLSHLKMSCTWTVDLWIVLYVIIVWSSPFVDSSITQRKGIMTDIAFWNS